MDVGGIDMNEGFEGKHTDNKNLISKGNMCIYTDNKKMVRLKYRKSRKVSYCTIIDYLHMHTIPPCIPEWSLLIFYYELKWEMEEGRENEGIRGRGE